MTWCAICFLFIGGGYQFHSCQFIANNVRQMGAGGPIMFSPVFSASAGLSPERAEVAMCKAYINIINPKALHMAASDQLRFRITRFPLAYCGLLCACKLACYLNVLFPPPILFLLSWRTYFSRAFMRDLIYPNEYWAVCKSNKLEKHW